MMQRRTVYHAQDGYRRTLITDDENPFVVNTFTEVHLDPILRAVAEAKDSSSKLRHQRHVAKVPLTVYEQSLREGWDDGDWKKWLNDPQNKPFRVWEGQV